MSQAKPKVSVIIPSYNHARYLPQRIESILNQTYRDFEIIILDDCSPDNSREIIAGYAAQHNNISIFSNERNSGSTFFQWKKGLKLAKGKYVWIAESDDYAEPTFLAELVAILDADATLAMAYTNSTIVTEDNYPTGTTADWKNVAYHTTHWAEDFIVDGMTELNNYLSKTCTVNNASSVLFRKNAMLDAGGVDTSFRYTGDWLMYQKLCLQGRIAYRAACLSNYREHSANASKASGADSIELLERQKCFAFVFDKAISQTALADMLTIASREFFAMTYNLLVRSWKPSLFFKYMKQIGNINSHYSRRIFFLAASLIGRKQQ
jgi:glycosyltransferase involved in cell wall biosynthesis